MKTAISLQPLLQPYFEMVNCAKSTMRMDPMPIPAAATPMAVPRFSLNRLEIMAVWGTIDIIIRPEAITRQ
jgi:hypothetical protein